MKRLPIFSTLAAGAALLTWSSYRKSIERARLRIRTGRRTIDSPQGPIEFAESGTGPAVLVIHGAGGGFDQGLTAGHALLGEGYRIIAPSRFGYLGTPLPRDASPQAQADAYVHLLDALQLERAPVIGMSAGAPSAMQFCLRHPERASALVLLVPLAFAPDGGIASAPKSMLTALFASDFLFWLGTKVAHSALVEKILGTPMDVYRRASPQIRQQLDRTLDEILPVSKRVQGLWNEGEVAANLTRYPLETMRVPTLVISTEDDGYRTFEGARYTAEQTHGTFVGYHTGGHLLVGHDEEVRTKITTFLQWRDERRRAPVDGATVAAAESTVPHAFITLTQ